MAGLTQEEAPQIKNRSLVFIGGLFLLALTILVWLLWLEMFTEALLTPFYCCDLVAPPSLGNWQQRLNDFFSAFPGRLIPTALFFLASGLVFCYRTKRAKNRIWLPFMFFGAYSFLLLASLVVTELSWWLSNSIVGPRSGGIDAGYHRTWYGLLSHFLLWSFFFLAMTKIRLPGDRRQES